jgi:hypothetical protein
MVVTGRAAVWAASGLAALSLAIGAAGCRGRAAGVPQGAKFEKAGPRIQYTAAQDGTVYVVDDWYNRLVYSGRVRAGDEVVVNPAAGTLTVNGKDQAGGRKLTDAEHSIYVQAGRADGQ